MEKFGLSAEVIQRIQSVFRSFEEVEKVILFGSRATGNFRPNSDIDIALKGEHLSNRTLLNIESQLDDLLLPVKFDLFIFHQISNPDFIENINSTGIEIYTSK